MSRLGTTPTMADVFREGLEDRLRDLHTALPAEVLEYDSANQTITARPTVRQAILDDDGRYVEEDIPEIYDVPVMFPRTAAGYITFPIVPGDTVLLVFCERSIGQWRYTGTTCSAGDQSPHPMSAAVAIPGLYGTADKLASVSTQHVVIGVVGTPTKLLLGSPSASDFVALSSKVEAELAKIKSAIKGAAVTAGDGGAAFKSNIMSALNSSGMGASGSTAATKVKAV